MRTTTHLRLRPALLALVLLLPGPFSSFGQALDQPLRDAALWTGDAEAALATLQPYGFQNLSGGGGQTAQSRMPGLTLGGMAVVEANAAFAGGKLGQLVLVLYSRGDQGDLGAEAFQQRVRQAGEALDAWTGKTGVLLRDVQRTATATLRKKVWVDEPRRIELEWSYTQERQGAIRAEFIRATLRPYDASMAAHLLPGASRAPTQHRTLTALELRARAKPQPGGDLLIEGVPMVDQGQKGYCVAATAERLFRYYEREFDQHEMAQLANTSADGGTRMDAMRDALRRIAGSMEVRVGTLFDLDLTYYERLRTAYNREAKKRAQPEIPEQRMINIGEVFSAMDFETLKAVRVRQSSDFARFRAHIQKHVQNGAPLAWSLFVGKVPETPDLNQAGGGHMRLIIGCNPQTGELLYSDSWGPGHELKRMKLDDAWSVTTGLYSVLPQNIRF